MFLKWANVISCLDNIAYNSKEADQLPTNSVLGILQFSFHPEISQSNHSGIYTMAKVLGDNICFVS